MPVNGDKHPNMDNWFWSNGKYVRTEPLGTSAVPNMPVDNYILKKYGIPPVPNMDNWFWSNGKYVRTEPLGTSAVPSIAYNNIPNKYHIPPVPKMVNVVEMNIGTKYMVNKKPQKLISKIQKKNENQGNVHSEPEYNLTFEKDVMNDVNWSEKFQEVTEGGNNKRANHTKKSKSKKSRKNRRKSTRRH